MSEDNAAPILSRESQAEKIAGDLHGAIHDAACLVDFEGRTIGWAPEDSIPMIKAALLDFSIKQAQRLTEEKWHVLHTLSLTVVELSALRAELAQMRTERDNQYEFNAGQIAKYAALEASKSVWRCFHCGFETPDEKLAAAHFGDRDDPAECAPLCRWWSDMSPEERGQALQDVVLQLNQERDDSEALRAELETAKREMSANCTEDCRKCVTGEGEHNYHPTYLTDLRTENDALRVKLEAAETAIARGLKSLFATTDKTTYSVAVYEVGECVKALRSYAAMQPAQTEEPTK